MEQAFGIVGFVPCQDANTLFIAKGELLLRPVACSGEVSLQGQACRFGQLVAVVKDRSGAALLLQQLSRHLVGDAWHVGEQVDIFRFRHG